MGIKVPILVYNVILPPYYYHIPCYHHIIIILPSFFHDITIIILSYPMNIICWFINPMNTIVISTINHGYWYILVFHSTILVFLVITIGTILYSTIIGIECYDILLFSHLIFAR